MQRNTIQNTKAKISQFWASICDVFKYWKIALITLVLVGSVGGGLSSLNATAVDGPSKAISSDNYINLTDCAIYLSNYINNIAEDAEIGPCVTENNSKRVFNYNCRKLKDDNLFESWQVIFAKQKVLVSCQRLIGAGADGQPTDEANSCISFTNVASDINGAGRDLSLKGDVAKCKPILQEFCSYMSQSGNFDSGSAKNLCTVSLGFTAAELQGAKVGGDSGFGQTSVTGCTPPSAEELTAAKLKVKNLSPVDINFCKTLSGAIYYCQSLDVTTKKGEGCISANEIAKASETKTIDPGGSTTTGGAGGAIGGLFSILYKVVITILLIVLILIEYVQMIILTIMAYVISALLDLSPSAPILTRIGLPLWQIFANLANFLVVGFMVYVGAATMIGLRKTDQAGKDVVTIAVLAMLLNTTYFFLNFVISTMDGFSRLLITVFVGKGGLFGLFTGMFGLFSKVSVLRDGKSAIDTANPFSTVTNLGGAVSDIGTTAAKAFNGSDSELTFIFLGEALIVVSFFIILLIFKDTFVLVFARVTILLLLLITSPVWVVAFFLKDIFKSSPISAAISKLPSQLFGTIVFNFALVLGVIITVLVTGTAQEGFKDYKLDVTGAGGNIASGAGAGSDSFLGPNGASLVIAGVVPVFLGVAILYFVNNAFKGLIPLLDQVGTAIGNGATDFAKGIITGDVKGGIAKFAKGATTLATGGGQLENVATLAPKLAVKGGVMGLGGLAGIADTATGGRLGLQQRLANAEDRFIKPMVYKPSEAFSNWAGERFGENSDQNLNARERTKRIRDQKKGIRDDRNRGVVANSMDEYNNSNTLTGGRRFLVTGANAKLDADIAEKRMNAGKKNIEQEGRQRFIDGNANRIQDAARLDALANDRENTVNNNLSTEEERGKRTYLEGDGVRLGELLDQSKNQLNELQGINKGIKDIQEARNENTFVTDPANRANIEERASLQTSAEILKKTTAANRGVVEEAGRQGYYNSADGKAQMDAATTATLLDETSKSNTDKIKAGLETLYNQDSANAATIQDNASAKLSAETVRRTATATRGVVEEAGKKAYYDSATGQAELTNAINNELNKELDGSVTSNLKSGQESKAKASYYKDSGNNERIYKTAVSSIKTELNKEIDEAEISAKKSNIDADVYQGYQGELEAGYNKLSSLKYGPLASSLTQAEARKKANKKTVTAGYQTKLDQENAAKRFKERQDKEREDAAAYAAAKAGTGTADQVESYNDAFKEWKQIENQLIRERFTFKNNPENYTRGVVTSSFVDMKPDARLIIANMSGAIRDHVSKKP